jgi:hypothetical protein
MRCVSSWGQSQLIFGVMTGNDLRGVPAAKSDLSRPTALMHTACTMSELVALGDQTDLKWDEATMFGLERDDFSLNQSRSSF